MVDISKADFFSDPDLADDPYPYFDELRSRCPVHPIAHPRVVAVTGYDEAVEIYRDAASFSACNAVAGPFPPLEGHPENDDISEYVRQHRDHWIFHEYMITMDGRAHERERGLLRRIMTSRRLQENRDAMAALADLCIDEIIDAGEGEIIHGYAGPFTTLVIADLLGMPEKDRDEYRITNLGHRAVGALGGTETLEVNLLEYMSAKFMEYVVDRRGAPRDDVLTQLATATYPDGEVPDPEVVVRLASFLFGAGQDTTARLIGAALRILAEERELQDALRADPALVPDFVEEALRWESPTKSDFRFAQAAATVGGVDIPVGTTVMLHPGAANRDPRRFDEPDRFRLDRKNTRDHIAFGRGAHTCPGAPLARAEATVTLQRFLDRTRTISISEEHHGPAGERRFGYEPTYILRGLNELHITFTPA